MHDDYHTGLRTIKDILTAEEAFSQMIEDRDGTNPDFTWRMMKNTLKSGYVTFYSSNPIKPGTFITPSQIMARDYAGSGKIYKKRVPITEVAWIDDAEGEYAPIGSYFQQQGKYAGAYDPVQNIIHIFDAGNQSTILHESAHMYLSILKRMAQEIPDNKKIQSDLETIHEWAAFSEDHLKEYEDSIKESMTEEFEDALDEMTTNYEREILNSDPIYKVAEIYNSDRWPTQDAKKKWMEYQGYTEESLREALDKAGGTLEDMGDTITGMDKSDPQARTFLSQEVYDKVYTPAMKALENHTGRSKGQCVRYHPDRKSVV